MVTHWAKMDRRMKQNEMTGQQNNRQRNGQNQQVDDDGVCILFLATWLMRVYVCVFVGYRRGVHRYRVLSDCLMYTVCL